MKFKIGPWNYLVQLSDPAMPLVDDVCLPAASIHSWSERTIWLAGSLPAEQRLDALIFELARAYQSHFGFPADDQQRANLMSSFAVDAWRQLEDQGGIDALIRLAD